jgi:hypothetical protein
MSASALPNRFHKFIDLAVANLSSARPTVGSATRGQH